jgi:hypothetical protein
MPCGGNARLWAVRHHVFDCIFDARQFPSQKLLNVIQAVLQVLACIARLPSLLESPKGCIEL